MGSGAIGKSREEKNQYHREWYAKNKDRVRAINARYWEKKLASLAAEQGASDERKTNQ